jgi:hypothetical protein
MRAWIVFTYATSLVSVVVTTVASAVEYRWTFEMAGGTESAHIQNKFGSELTIECRSGMQFNIPTLYLDSKRATRRSDLYVRFVIDGKNYPVSFSKGIAEPGGRLTQNAIGNFVTALNDAKSKSFTAEYPDINKKDSFSTLNVRDAVGAIVEGCLNVLPEKDK